MNISKELLTKLFSMFSIEKILIIIFLIELTEKAIVLDITIIGYVRDEKSKETLLGVNVYSEAANINKKY